MAAEDDAVPPYMPKGASCRTYPGKMQTTIEGAIMGEGINTDKVVVNAGGSGDGGAGSMAAIIAALGNRNQSDAMPALIAALGHRKDDSGWGSGGINGILAIAALGLIFGRGGRGGGLFGGGDCDGGDGAVNQLTLTNLLSKLGTIEGAIPLSASQTQNSILEQTNTLQQQLSNTNLATLAALAGVKDSVTNTGTVLLNSNNQNTQQILSALCGLGSKIDANQIADLQRQLAVAQSDISEERNYRRTKEVEVNVSQNVNQQQAQLQAQAQTQDLLRSLLLNISEGNQIARATNQMITVGSAGVVGNQAANPTNVRA